MVVLAAGVVVDVTVVVTAGIVVVVAVVTGRVNVVVDHWLRFIFCQANRKCNVPTVGTDRLITDFIDK